MIPHCSTVHMHAGKGNGKEGSWEGDGANMHFELMMDQFDILFNLVLRVCAQGVCKILACMHACMSRFWVEKGARKHRKNNVVLLAKPYGPGLKTRLR